MENLNRGPATKHPLYKTWDGMHQRCYNPRHAAYNYYGGRGVTICQEWISKARGGTSEAFWNFVDHVGPKPEAEYTLDRIDCDLPYQPGNVRWATKSEQSYNRVFGRSYVA